jgi:hypothetical protein
MTKYLTYSEVSGIIVKMIKMALPDVPNKHIYWYMDYDATQISPQNKDVVVVLGISPTGPSGLVTTVHTDTVVPNNMYERDIYYRHQADLVVYLIGKNALSYYYQLEPAIHTSTISQYILSSGMGIVAADDGIKDLTILKETINLPIISKLYKINWTEKVADKYNIITSVVETDIDEIV